MRYILALVLVCSSCCAEYAYRIDHDVGEHEAGKGTCFRVHDYIVTCAHVVSVRTTFGHWIVPDNSKFTVFVDGKAYSANLVSWDSVNDLALLTSEATKHMKKCKLDAKAELKYGKKVTTESAAFVRPAANSTGLLLNVKQHIQVYDRQVVRGCSGSPVFRDKKVVGVLTIGADYWNTYGAVPISKAIYLLENQEKLRSQEPAQP